jgi:hypothetical protein
MTACMSRWSLLYYSGCTNMQHLPQSNAYPQVGFFNIVGLPLFKAMVGLFPNAQPMLDGALVNYHEWEKAASATTKAP